MPDEPSEPWSKSWVPWLWRGWALIVTTGITLAFGFFKIFEQSTLSKEAWQWLFEKSDWRRGWIVLAAVLPLLIASLLFILVIQLIEWRRTGEIKRLATDEQKKTIELENLKSVFHDRERMRMLDHITGIPNFQSWEEDLKKWASRGLNENEFSLILIDLDKLRWLNSHSPACADEVLRYFARNTYESMRRDEQIYKAQEPAERSNKMYRHYQGGDEFFFIISADVYGTIGFLNRLARGLTDHNKVIRDKILSRYLKDPERGAFRLSFAAVISLIRPRTGPSTALANAYGVLRRAKESPESRLLVVFDTSYELPAKHRAGLEQELKWVSEQITTFENQTSDAPGGPRLRDLRDEEQKLIKNINTLKEAETVFKVRVEGN